MLVLVEGGGENDVGLSGPGASGRRGRCKYMDKMLVSALNLQIHLHLHTMNYHLPVYTSLLQYCMPTVCLFKSR